MNYPTYDDGDAGACYACGMTWLPDEGERHKAGCYRLDDPVGRPEPGTCYECGARETAQGYCTNEGQCRRWRDPGEWDDAWRDEEPPAHGELVVAARERLGEGAGLDDLPF